jgi:hypothetical protein
VPHGAMGVTSIGSQRLMCLCLLISVLWWGPCLAFLGSINRSRESGRHFFYDCIITAAIGKSVTWEKRNGPEVE